MYLTDEEQKTLIEKLIAESELSNNEILRLKAVYEEIENGLFSIGDKLSVSQQEILNNINIKLGKFFGKIDNLNIEGIYNNLENQCMHVFWELFEKYKLYNLIDSSKLDNLIAKNLDSVYSIVFQEKTVLKYGEVIKKHLIKYYPVFDVIIDYYFGEKKDRSKKLFLPKELTKEDKLEILKKYISWDKNNANYLRLLSKASEANTEYPITAEIKLTAKKQHDAFWDKHFEENSGQTFGVEVSFGDQEEVKKEGYKNGTYRYSYSRKWIKENLDFPTLCNNFIYLFELVDNFFISTSYSKKSSLGLFEELGVKGKNWYKKGISFDLTQHSVVLKLQAYETELQKCNISIDDLLKWFYESYLDEEFNIKNFHYQRILNEVSDVDKCILISCGIDNILKQFKVYCEKAAIDREYLEINLTPVSYNNVGSLIKNKYAYVSNDEKGALLKREMNLLFGNNYALSHCEKLKSSKKRFKNIIQLLSKEHIHINDFYKHQRDSVRFLIERGALLELQTGLKVNVHRASLLKFLYENECLALSYLNSFSSIIDDLIASGELVTESELFSRPE